MTPVFARVRAKVRLDKLASLGTRYSLLSTLVFAALAAAPLFSNPGFLSTRGGGDSPFLILRLHQLLVALQSGQFPVRWMPDADFGYGYPFFNYYAAFPYYLAALLKLYGCSFVLSLKLTQLAALLAAAAGVYAWARSLKLSPAQAVLASAAYTFAPFHLVNLYVRGDSLSELWAMAWYPLALWRAQRCLEKPTAGRAFTLALCVALLICTHNISALNFMPFLGLYLLLGSRTFFYRQGREESKALSSAPVAVKRVGVLMGTLLWGLALSAFFWLPALSETKSVQIGDVTQGYFFYANHFRSADLIQPRWFFNYEPTPDQPTPFSLGLVQSLATLGGLIALAWQALRQRRWSWAETFVVLGLALSTWMMTPASRWVWDHAPLVKYTQFPWRFLSIQSLFAALVIARVMPVETANTKLDALRAGSWTLSEREVGASSLLPAACSLVLAIFSLGGLRPDFIPLADADVTPERLQLYEMFTANIGSTIGYEYLPRAVQPRPYTSETALGRVPRLKVLSGAARGEQIWKRGAAEQWKIEVTKGPATVAVPTHYWPGWKAEADGQPLSVRAAESLGWIAFDLPLDTHTVTLRLGPTPLRSLAEALSLFALVIPLAAFFREAREVPKGRKVFGGVSRTHLILLSLLVIGAVILHARPPAAESSLPLSLDFVQLAYPHRDVVRFTDGTRLVRAEFSADHLARGATLTVETDWQSAKAGEVSLRLVPFSNLLSPVPVTLASATAMLGPGSATLPFSLALPSNISPGVYLLTLEHSSGPALTPAGRERGPVQLGPVWVDDLSPAGPVLSLQDFGPAIQVLTVTTESIAPDALRVNLLWRALADVPRNYALALRLRDVAGYEWAAFDTQTGGGYYPTHLWRPGEVVPDSYNLSLPLGTPPGDYSLTLSLYDPVTLVTLGEATVTATVREAASAEGLAAQFQLVPEIGLGQVDYPAQFTQGEAPQLMAHWLVAATPAQAYRARWTLIGAEGAAFSQTLDLAPGSSPLAWRAQAFILGHVWLGTPPTLAPGDYALELQLVDENDKPIGDVARVGRVVVLGRPRVFVVPPMQVTVGATFGDKLKLWGYNAEHTDLELRLTLVWGALTEPRADYKFFVHLFNPADEFVTKQVDMMPHDSGYATALWTAGEVVTDTVTFSLADVPPGEYQLAVGWYDPAAPDVRLPAFDAQGQRLDLDRVILPLTVTAP